jgi:catechol 2,3-dioxygenase-like lactoylglutathione lyase family enzyme
VTSSDDVAAQAVMVPMLPCADVDAMLTFWAALGLTQTYRQVRPNPYVAVALGRIDLHYYGMDGWDPEQSHSTCQIVVPDTRPLFELFQAGLRTLYGKVPVAGFPRITRPRERANNGGLSGFSVIDPAGNWVRVSRAPAARIESAGDAVSWASAGGSKLARAVENAVVLADSHGDVPQARKALLGALRRAPEETRPVDRARALAFAVELAVRSGDAEDAAELLTALEDLVRRTPSRSARSALAEARAVVADS